MEIELLNNVTLFQGDCRETLRSLPDNSVDAVPCDPPYELNFMGKGWDRSGIANDPALWREVYRVLKPGGHLAAFSASRTYHRMTCAIEDAGFEIRDSLMWCYATGFPKSQNVSAFIDKYAPASPAVQEFDGFGTALKPAFEPIVLARKPLSEPTVAANVLKWRTGALNIDGCRVGTATESSGGRWPANVVTDGSDEVVGLFPGTSPARAGKPRKGKNGDGYGMTHTGTEYNDNGGSAARFFYSAKASKADRAGSKHPTVKPIALMQWLARLITPPGGTVLDPFAGSGTTGAAAVAEGFSAILCEQESEYAADIKRRIGEPFDNNKEVKCDWSMTPKATAF